MNDHDAPRRGAQDGFTDALTLSFGDADSLVFGIARLGLSGGRASGLAIVFAGGTPVAVRADGDVESAAGGWDDVQAAGLRHRTLEPGKAWQLTFDGDSGAGAFELTFDATSPPIVLDAQAPAAQAGGMEGFDVVCRVHGNVDGRPFAGLGQRSRSWGVPDWERMSLARTVAAWLDDEHAITLTAVRPAKASGHDREAVAAFLFEGDHAEPVESVEEALLSTAYDGEGRQRRAGLELRLTDGHALHAAGEVVAGTSLDLGRLRLDCAFFLWRMAGRSGVGRYDVLHRR